MQMDQNETESIMILELSSIVGFTSTLVIAGFLYYLLLNIKVKIKPPGEIVNARGNTTEINLLSLKSKEVPNPNPPNGLYPRRPDLPKGEFKKRSIRIKKTELEFGDEEYIFWRNALGLVDKANFDPRTYSYLNQFNRELIFGADENSEGRLPIEWSHIKGLGIWSKKRKGYFHALYKVPFLIQSAFESEPGKFYVKTGELQEVIESASEVIQYRRSQLKLGTEKYPEHCQTIEEWQAMRRKLEEIYHRNYVLKG